VTALLTRLRLMADQDLALARRAVGALNSALLESLVLELAPSLWPASVRGVPRTTLEEVALSLLARDAVNRLLRELTEEADDGD
jgi:hypothetical protein